MAEAALRFRRHLALCVLALLVNELHLHWSGQQQRRVTLAEAAMWVGPAQMNAQDEHGYRSTQVQSQVTRFGSQTSNGANDLQHQHQQQQHQVRAPNDDDDDFSIVAAVLAYIDSYLPVLNFNYTMYEQQFDTGDLDIEVEKYYKEQFGANMTLDELHLVAIKAALRVAPMPLHTSWGYESRDEMRQGSLPVQDDSRCSAHLAQLSNRLDRLLSSAPPSGPQSVVAAASPPVGGPQLAVSRVAAHEASPVENFEAQQLYRSTDLQFLRYLDTFGKVPSDLLRGNTRWYGSYSGCLDTRLAANPQMGGTKRIKFRYCMAAVKSAAWPLAARLKEGNAFYGHQQQTTGNSQLASEQQQRKWRETYGIHARDAIMENYFFRLGICLPESCDTSAIDYQENLRNIEKLIKFNLMKPFNSDHYYVSDIYCLPDVRSPLRSVPLMGKLLVLAALAWMAIIGMATTVHLNVERFYTKAVKEIRRKQAAGSLEAAHFQSSPSSSSSSTSSSSSSSSSLPKDSDRMRAKQAERNKKRPNNEFKESDILNLKHYWLRFNVYLWDHSKTLISGVDLIACLSLYSNWLKYTNRLKLAVAQLHAEEMRRERIRVRNQRLVEDVRLRSLESGPFNATQDNGAQLAQQHKRTSGLSSKLGAGSGSNPENVGGSAQRLTGGGGSPTAIGNTASAQELATAAAARGQPSAFDRELTKRNEAKDDLDELDSDTIKRRVDTSSLNALKVIALVWIIAGHCIFYLGSTVSNGAILKNYVRDLAGFALAQGALYITELFFVITGCLTTYLAFKYNSFRQNASDKSDEDANGGGVGGVGGGGGGGQELVEQEQQRAATASNELQAAKRDDNETDRKRAGGPLPVVYMESRMFKLPFWLMLIIHRYLRILPTYLVVYSFVKLVSVYVGGYGQTWDYAVSANSMRRACVQESWLPVFTLTTNFVNIYNHCIVGGWYLSTDMQFMIFAVPMLLVMANFQRRKLSRLQNFVAFTKHQQQLTFHGETNHSAGGVGANRSQATTTGRQSPRNEVSISRKRLIAGYSIVVLMGLLSAIASMWYTITQSEVDLSYILKFVPHAAAVLSQNIAMYTNSIFRFRAFAFGLILGHLLYLYEFRLIKLPKMIQQHGAKLTSVVFVAGCCFMLIPVLYSQNKIIVSHDTMSILLVLSAGGIDIFLCVLIFLTCIGKAPKAALFFLNSPFWTVLSSLSLCAFLVHTEVIVLLTSQLNPPPTVGYNLLLLIFCATLIITYLLALALYLSFEMPVNRLCESLMRKYFSNSKMVRSDNAAEAQ